MHQDRILAGERNSLVIVKKIKLEKLESWKPESWYGWIGWSMAYVWAIIHKYSKIIIHNPYFEVMTIFVIMTNSVFLAIENPKQTTNTEWQNVIEYIYLALYTIEAMLKIIGLGFIFNKGAY